MDESSHFTNPNQNTRVRGLTSADNTRDYFLTDIPWDGYNVDGVDLQRGPNSILFGQGSPAGIINTRTKSAAFKDSNEVSFRVGSWGSSRLNVDFNKVLLKDELAIRVAAVDDDTKYKQDPAYSKSERLFGAVRYEPGFLKKGSARTIIKGDIEWGNIKSNNPRQLPPLDAITPWFQTGTFAGRDVNNQPTTFNYLNRLTVIPSQNEDDNTGLPNHAQKPSRAQRPHGLYGTAPNQYTLPGTANQYYQPWIGRTFGGEFGNPIFNVDGINGTQGTGMTWEPHHLPRHQLDWWHTRHQHWWHAVPASGGCLGLRGLCAERQTAFRVLRCLSRPVRSPDSSIFDFYNQLLDGDTKQEWQNFRTYNLSLAQTFFHDHLGFEGTYNNEWYQNGNLRLLNGDGQSVGIDMNSVYPDGTPTGKNGETVCRRHAEPECGSSVPQR